MSYHCKDCSYRGSSCGQGGACPACGSFNLHKIGTRVEEQQAPSRLSLAILIGLWSWLLVLVAWKLAR